MRSLRDDVAPPRHRHAASRLRHHPPRNRTVARKIVAVTAGVVLTALIVAAGVVVGFHLTSERSTQAGAPSTRFSATLSNSPTGEAAVPLPEPPGTGGLESDFAELQATLPGMAGIALAAVGAPHSPILLGDWSSGPAWSTIKVPLAIAALRAAEPSAVSDPMTSAITQSDNAAAELLWQGLGDPETAAAKIEAVLREVGDPTQVQSERIRPEFSAFGQTVWSLADQASFLAAAACDSRDSSILDLMGEIAGDQRWGLGTIARTRFKGGWGPSEEGAYLVRQIGVLPVDAGEVAVAIAVVPESGAFGDGTSELTQIAGWLRDHAAVLPAGRCPT